MASISPTSLSCPAEPHTGQGAYLKLEITSITDSDASTNKRYIGWKITFHGTPWVQLYKAYCSLGGTVLYNGEPSTQNWSVGQSLASSTATFNNDSAGNLSLSAYLKQLFFYGTWAWDRSGYYQEASTTMKCSQLPRYANISNHTVSSDINKIYVSWGADANYSAQRYSLDGGNWTDTTPYNYTLSGFTPGSTHTIRTAIRRADSELWSYSDTVTIKLKSLPSSNAVSAVNFNSSGTRVDVSISSISYLSSWYIKLYDGNTLVKDGSGSPNYASSTSAYWTISSSDSVGMLPRHGSDNEWNLTAKFYVVSNGTTYQLTDRTFKCKIPSNLYLPTYNVNNISYDVTDAKTLNLTNNDTKKVIKGVSNVQITSTEATPNGSSSMSSYVATSGTKSDSTANTTAPIIINLTAVNGSSVVVQAIDSRNRSTSATKQYDTFIDYFSPVIESASVNRIDGIGTNLSVNITGRYCYWSGLATSNTITQVSLQYRIKGDQNWTTISGVNLTLSVGTGNFTITGNITGNLFNAVNEYEVLLTFEDKIEEFSYKTTIPPGQAFIWRDLANNRLGINKKPEKTLDVEGDIKSSHNLYVNNGILSPTGTGLIWLSNNQWQINDNIMLHYLQKTLSEVSVYDTGSNANGSWIRFNNGVMICWHTIVGNKFNCTQSGGSGRYYYVDTNNSAENAKSWNYPQAFTTIPVVSAQVGSSAYSMNCVGGIAKTWCSAYCCLPYAVSNTQFTWEFIAIGLWK